MRYIFLMFLLSVSLFAGLIKSEIVRVDGDKAVIHIDEIEVGVSGFVVRKLASDRSTIVNAATVVRFDREKKEAELRLFDYKVFVNNNLPKGKWHTKKGDLAVLAFAYNRGLVIAPSEEIYYTLTRSMQGEDFVHPDVFATLLSFKGHPTPLKDDFQEFCSNVSIGLVFFYIEQHLYTVDCQSFEILNIQNAPLQQKRKKLPFYSRLQEIEANWFGEGSDELEDYEPYYYGLLYEENKNDKDLIRNILASKEKNVTKLAQELELEEKKDD